MFLNPICDPKVGLVPAILLFAVVSLVYMYTAYQLIKINNSLCAKRNIGRGIIQTNNDCARLCYIVLSSLASLIPRVWASPVSTCSISPS